jgi:23S rRNA (adenine2503-C2)-methyltransferase
VNLDAVSTLLAGQPAYRTRQVWEWTARGATSFDEMTNLSVSLRKRLSEAVPCSTLRVVEEA